MVTRTTVLNNTQSISDNVRIDRTDISELLLLQRIALGLNYAPTITRIAPILKFGFSHIVNIVAPLSISIWKSDSHQSWSLLAADGAAFTPPPPFSNWIELNQRAMLMRQPLVIHTDGKNSGENMLAHWAIPVLLPAGSCYVLHVLAPRNQISKDTMETFLSAFAFLLIKCDGDISTTDNDHSGGSNAHSSMDSLSDRQREILQLAGQHLTYAQIGRRLGFSESTIKQESMKIFRILGVNNKTAALKSIAI